VFITDTEDELLFVTYNVAPLGVIATEIGDMILVTSFLIAPVLK